MATTPSTATSRLRPVWLSEVPPAACGTLTQDVATEVCIVGGGIAALTTAWLLLQSGKQVTLLLPQDLRSGPASQSSAHLSSALPMRYHQLASLHGEPASRLIAASQVAGIELLESISCGLHLECGFTRLNGYLMVPPGENVQELEREYAAIRRAGLTSVRWVDSVPIPRFPSGRCLQFPDQAQFHPLRYLSQLAGRIVSAGGRIFGQTTVATIIPGSHPVVRTACGRQVRSGAVVWADSRPLGAVLEGAPAPEMDRCDHHVIAARVGVQSDAPMLLWDTGTPDHQARLADLGGDGVSTPRQVLIVSSRHPLLGDDIPHEQRFRMLELWALERFPSIERIEYRWNYQASSASDGLVSIGRVAAGAGGVYLGSDDAGNSLTNSFVAALVNCSSILGHAQPWAAVYDPNRQGQRVLVAHAESAPSIRPPGLPAGALKRESWSLPVPKSARQS